MADITIFPDRQVITALPGETVYLKPPRVFVNGEALEEPYLPPDAETYPSVHGWTPLRIPPDHYFVMGDNRAESEDSRAYGPVPRGALLGFLEL